MEGKEEVNVVNLIAVYMLAKKGKFFVKRQVYDNICVQYKNIFIKSYDVIC